MASRLRVVDEIKEEESRGGADPGVPMDPLTKLLAEVWPTRGLIAAALEAAGPRVWMGGPPGCAPGEGAAAGGPAGMGSGLVVRFELKKPSCSGPYRYVRAKVPLWYCCCGDADSIT